MQRKSEAGVGRRGRLRRGRALSGYRGNPDSPTLSRQATNCRLKKVKGVVYKPQASSYRLLVTSGASAGHRAARRGRGVRAHAVRARPPRRRRLRQRRRGRVHPADQAESGAALEEHLRHVHGAEDQVSVPGGRASAEGALLQASLVSPGSRRRGVSGPSSWTTSRALKTG